jgi:hypothetical protein
MSADSHKLGEVIAVLKKIWDGMPIREAIELLENPVFISNEEALSYTYTPGQMVIGAGSTSHPRIWFPPLVMEQLTSEMGLSTIGKCDETSTEPAPAPPPKPFKQAVADTYRYLKEVTEKLPESQCDRSVREEVGKGLDGKIKEWDDKKPWPGSFPNCL